ncbi:MAG: hypothetical protein LBC92_04635 [Rickettsiales bacterium]|jgi:hypothetical protein|nr:hypothetical protein [Rickettsiales bacterium]
MTETIYEKTLKEFQKRLASGKLDKLDEIRIANFIARYPSKKWTREQVIADCIANEKLCARMSKDAIKQNLDEAEIIKKIGAEALSAGGKSNIRFRMDSGEIVIVAKAEYGLTKSADFVMDYKGKKIYGSQKTIHGEGGHRTTQVREAIEFVRAGNKKHKAIAVIDGKEVKEFGVYTSNEVVVKKIRDEDL